MKLKMNRRARENVLGYLFVSIWIIGFLVFTLIPIVKTMIFSFKNVTITAEGIKTSYVGLKNYKGAFLSDVKFVEVIIQYIGEIILYVPIVIVFALIISLILNMKIFGKGFLRTIFFLPVIIISGPVMKEFIEQGVTSIQGVDNIWFVQRLLATMPTFLSTLLSTLIQSFIMILWFSGVQILIFLSALQKIDRPVYEAAQIDGASKWESFWKITLPNLRSIIVINIIYTIIAFSTFTLNDVIVMIQDSIFSATAGLGYASALAWIYFVVLVLVIGLFMILYGPKADNIYGKSIRKINKEKKAIQKRKEQNQKLIDINKRRG